MVTMMVTMMVITTTVMTTMSMVCYEQQYVAEILALIRPLATGVSHSASKLLQLCQQWDDLIWKPG